MRRRCELLPLADRPRSRRQDKREKYYDSRSIGCFMFRIDDEVVVDATLVGNAGRFINHSCDPNCASRIIQVEGAKHIVIFAERPIEAGEELTYDYKVRAVVRRCGTTLWHEVVARGCGTTLWRTSVGAAPQDLMLWCRWSRSFVSMFYRHPISTSCSRPSLRTVPYRRSQDQVLLWSRELPRLHELNTFRPEGHFIYVKGYTTKLLRESAKGRRVPPLDHRCDLQKMMWGY